jgi:hypothetical protein
MVRIISNSYSCRRIISSPSDNGSDNGNRRISRSSHSNSPSLFKGPQTIGQMTIDMVALGYIVEFGNNRNVIKWYQP